MKKNRNGKGEKKMKEYNRINAKDGLGSYDEIKII